MRNQVFATKSQRHQGNVKRKAKSAKLRNNYLNFTLCILSFELFSAFVANTSFYCILFYETLY